MTGPCPFCGRHAAELVGDDDVRFCAACADLVDVPAALAHLPESPSSLGKYALGREIGCGGAARVYEARDPALNRRVALKVLDVSALDAFPAKRFFREARLLARVRHPNVVEIFELGRDGSRVFIAMEYVEGSDFPGNADRDEALRRLVLVARALHHVHQQGIIHRDLKPSNVRVDPSGRPVIMDFGIARAGDGEASLTATGAVLGTLGSMAPEQLWGDSKEADARTDVYALGIMLYEVLAGRPPYVGASMEEFSRRLKTGQVPGPRAARADVPAALDALCRSAMAVDRDARPRSAAAFADSLEAAMNPPARHVERRLLLAGAAGAIAAVASWRLIRPSPPPPPPPLAPAPEFAEAAARRAKAITGGLGHDAAVAELEAADALYRKGLASSPKEAAAWAALAGLRAELGRAKTAHEAFDRALDLEPGNREWIHAKGEAIVTLHLAILFDRKAWPRTARELAARVAAFAPRTSVPGPDAAMYRDIARGAFAEARAALPKLNLEGTAILDFALSALQENGRPAAPFPWRGEEDGEAFKGERRYWLPLLRLLDRRLPASLPRPRPMAPRLKLHATALRVEAAVLETRGETARALDVLGQSLRSDPDGLLTLLARVRLKSPAGDMEAALTKARGLGFAADALEEIGRAAR